LTDVDRTFDSGLVLGSLGASLLLPLGDALIATMATVALLNSRSRPILLVGCGALTLALADSFFFSRIASTSLLDPSIADVTWVMGFGLVAFAGVDPRRVVLVDGRPPSASTTASNNRSILVYATVLAGALALVIAAMRGWELGAVPLLLAGILGLAAAANQLASFAQISVLNRKLTRNLLKVRRSDERTNILLDRLADAVILVGADGRLQAANLRLEELRGGPNDEVIGVPIIELTAPPDRPIAERALAQLIAKTPTDPPILRIARSDDVEVWVEVNAADLLEEPSIGAIVLTVRDVTDRLKADAALRSAEERFRAAFAAAPIGMTLMDGSGRLVEVNAAFATMLGLEPGELNGRQLVDITVPEDWPAASELLRSLRRDSGAVRFEQRYRGANGRIVLASVSASLVDNGDLGGLVIGQVEDITEQRAIADRLEHSARFDEVTGLSNRASFIERLGEVLSLAGENEAAQVAVLFLDLDRFKVVNDSLGHAAGDDLLRAVGARLRSVVRAEDLVARFGGDEFTVLVNEVTSEAEVVRLAERVAAQVAVPIPLASGETFVTVSIGVAFADRAGVSPDGLVRDADLAMYRAKERGRNRVERFERDTLLTAVRSLRTANDLHRALERHQFRVHYQPIVELGSGRLRGVEALVRWEHPQRGVLHPEQFIGLAEDTGLIVPIGRQVLFEAFGQVARWQAARPDREPLQVSVNLSARQLAVAGLSATVASALTETGIDPSSVWLELTEHVLMADAKAVGGLLRELRELGVHLSIDDFGTGWSSLTYLQHYPVQGIKIDRTFVQGLGIHRADTAIVESLIGLGRALGLAVVAEGVDTPLKLRLLRELGCELAQGFLVGPPRSAEETAAALLGAPTNA
jgi:diguanylate cyclase (GGDEF)-like protein/PAS domain S-box-containing protein